MSIRTRENQSGTLGARYPWRAHNQAHLLINGEQFVPAMLHAIRNARRHVLLEMYLVEPGRVADLFIDALLSASRRGVMVCVLLDAFGSRTLPARDTRRLTDAGVRLGYYNPLHLRQLWRYVARNHRKLLAVDDEIAFTGGTGLVDGVHPTDRPAFCWRETMLEIRGPVVGDWTSQFLRTWQRAMHMALPLRPRRPASVADGIAARVSVSQTIPPRAVTAGLMSAVRHARQRVWISTAYWIPKRRLLRALRNAVNRGVDVRVLVPGPMTDHATVRCAGQRYYTRLLTCGVRVYEYQPRFLHAKVQLCDDWVSVGSSNLDRWNLRRNLEANQEIIDPNLAGEVETMFRNDFKVSIQIEAEQWKCRPRKQRFLEWFCGSIETWIEPYT